MDPAQFYTGLVAEVYAPLRSGTSEAELYRRFVVGHGEPALELGCGDGDPILDLRAAGLDVEGVDSSADMLERCAVRATRRGLSVVTYCQRMQELDLPRRYATMYVAGGTFTVLPDDAAGAATLCAMAAHLRPGGTVLLSLWVPPATAPNQLGIAREGHLPDGSEISVAVVDETWDPQSRSRSSVLRYERRSPDGTVETLDRPWLIHWYTPAGFADLAGRAGFRVLSCTDDDTGGPAGEGSRDFTVLLRR